MSRWSSLVEILYNVPVRPSSDQAWLVPVTGLNPPGLLSPRSSQQITSLKRRTLDFLGWKAETEAELRDTPKAEPPVWMRVAHEPRMPKGRQTAPAAQLRKTPLLDQETALAQSSR